MAERHVTQHGKDSVPAFARAEPPPAGYVPPEQTILDRMLGGTLSAAEVSQLIMEDAYAGLREFCEIPLGYHHCTLGWERWGIESAELDDLESMLAGPPPGKIIDPHPSHLKAIALFQLFLAGDPLVCENRDPFRAKLGANLTGPPGTGKTHIAAAFALQLKERHDKRIAAYRAIVEGFVKKEYVKYQKDAAKLADPHSRETRYELTEGDIVAHADPTTAFLAALDDLKRRLRGMPFQPTDLLYLGFDALYELCRSDAQRAGALKAIEDARVVFIDDVHPKGDPERAQVVQHLIERRYELGRFGTFITTNLDTKSLGGGDERIEERLLSRSSEMFVVIDFTDAIDWRRQVKGRRIALVNRELDARVAELTGADDGAADDPDAAEPPSIDDSAGPPPACDDGGGGADVATG